MTSKEGYGVNINNSNENPKENLHNKDHYHAYVREFELVATQYTSFIVQVCYKPSKV